MWPVARRSKVGRIVPSPIFLMIGNRGTVRRWDAGTYTEEAEAQCWRLEGTRIRGCARLERHDESRWVFVLSTEY